MVSITNSQLRQLEITEEVYAKILKIKAFTFDIDGVMTDGSILVSESGDFLRTYSAKDGFGLRMASMGGYKLGIITGAHSDTVEKRFKFFGFGGADIYLSSKDKIADFNKFCEKYGLKPEEVLYCGDDVPDAPVLNACGLGVCPADAMEEAKLCADYVSVFPAGARFVREIIEIVMRAQGTWNFDVSEYEKSY